MTVHSGHILTVITEQTGLCELSNVCIVEISPNTNKTALNPITRSSNKPCQHQPAT